MPLSITSSEMGPDRRDGFGEVIMGRYYGRMGVAILATNSIGSSSSVLRQTCNTGKRKSKFWRKSSIK
ncbi:hypothetical protein PAXINDRAFT_21740 [Paxillus involutus ATCC 200175]|uniref:Uncharacterized protein n=1 Tax=Paxillus involutus ATCC 200175 TaxID=664439 RepID=A0A0C9SSX4_PAXIN|nr:hypothetical protein PAXINDRAFT_21740 [Paxillus involutus ATCC 200175]